VILGKIALATLGAVVLGGTVLCSEGLITVRVREHKPNGSHVFVVAPAMLAPIAMRFAPQERLQEAEKQIRPYLPTIRAAVGELEKCSDATFVEVQSPDEHVRISKSSGAIVIDVDDTDDTVHVSVPIRAVAVQSAIEELASAGPTA
jgi:hypothetical protein